MKKKYLLLSLLAWVTLSCKADETSLTVEVVKDFDTGTSLAQGVILSIDGQIFNWEPDKPVIYQIREPSSVNFVRIIVDESEFELVSSDEFRVNRGEQLRVELMVRHFEEDIVAPELKTALVIQKIKDQKTGAEIDKDIQLKINGRIFLWNQNNPVVYTLEDPEPLNNVRVQLVDSRFELVSSEIIDIGMGEKSTVDLFVSHVAEPPEIVEPKVPEPHLLRVLITPGTGSVILTDVDSDLSHRFRHNEQKEIPGGRYEWSAAAAGYVPDNSRTPITLQEGKEDVLRITLTAKRSVEIVSEPEGANIVFTGNRHGEVYEVTAPAAIKLVPDFYRWQSVKAGHDTLSSGDIGQTDLDLLSPGQTDIVWSIQMRPLDTELLLRNADNYYQNSDFGRALASYNMITRPERCVGSMGHDFRHSRNRMGWIYLNERDYFSLDDARSAYEKVLECDRNDYVALMYLGHTLVELGNYSAARSHLNRILGPLQTQIVQRDRAFVTSYARYWIAKSYYREYDQADSHDDKVRLAMNVISHFSDFVLQAEGTDGLDPYINNANARIEMIRREME